ncbi:MAG: hypothetical protein RIS34_1753 [Pseudomonadota bacterium]|jgi:hypothetical protein
MKKSNPDRLTPATGVLLASLVLPGLAALTAIAPSHAVAETAPEKTTLAIKYGSYSDSQPGMDRVSVKAPLIYIQAPMAGNWSVEGSWVGDSVSGATPMLHSNKTMGGLGGASRMSDYRKAADVKVTRYFARSAVSASLAYSDEHDYTSRALGLDARWSSEDNNRTWTLGYGASLDKIDSNYSGNSIATDQHKHTREIMGGVTQVLTPTDIAQFNLTRSVGNGYFDDPYKFVDHRPGQRNNWIALVRWNHHVEKFDASVHSSYRYYTDTFGVKSHTLGLEWAQPKGQWTLTPGARYYTQSAANFYVAAALDPSGQYDPTASALAVISALGANGVASGDQRLSAFGAVTLSMKVSYALKPDTVVDLKYERYRQTSGLRLGGAGSVGIDPFNATFMQVGLTHRF